MSHVAEALERACELEQVGHQVSRWTTAIGGSRRPAPVGALDAIDIFRSESRAAASVLTLVAPQAVGEIGDILARIADPALRAEVLLEANKLYGHDTMTQAATHAVAPHGESVPSMIDAFVRDFQQLVREWNAAESES